MEDPVAHYIHPTAIVDTTEIGAGSRIWAFVHILKQVRIGKNANICDHCFIEQNVGIGDNVTVKSGVYIWEGVTIEDEVFIGPNVAFTNDLRPRSKQYKQAISTRIKHGASIGANSAVLAGVIVGRYAMAGAGSVITKDVPDHALVYGNPARIMGWVDEAGEKLQAADAGTWVSQNGTIYITTNDGLTRQ